MFNVSFEDIDATNNTGITSDILATDLYGNLVHYNKEAAGTYTESILATSIANPASVGFYDLDNDTVKDIILSSGTNGVGNDLVWFKNNGAGSFSAEDIIDDTQSNTFKFTVINQKITLGIENNTLENLKIYPNPVSNELFIESTNAFNDRFSVYNLLGKELLKGSVNNDSSINVTTLKKGMYFLKLANSNTTFKFIKQ